MAYKKGTENGKWGNEKHQWEGSSKVDLQLYSSMRGRLEALLRETTNSTLCLVQCSYLSLAVRWRNLNNYLYCLYQSGLAHGCFELL